MLNAGERVVPVAVTFRHKTGRQAWRTRIIQNDKSFDRRYVGTSVVFENETEKNVIQFVGIIITDQYDSHCNKAFEGFRKNVQS